MPIGLGASNAVWYQNAIVAACRKRGGTIVLIEDNDRPSSSRVRQRRAARLRSSWWSEGHHRFDSCSYQSPSGRG
jgi:hypothetical protein